MAFFLAVLAVFAILTAFRLHFFEALCVRRADKVRLHVVNSPLWVHEVLIVLSFDLYHAHNYTVDHVNGLSLIFFSFNTLDTLLVVLDALSIDHLLLVITLSLDIFLKDAILDACAPLVVLLQIIRA